MEKLGLDSPEVPRVKYPCWRANKLNRKPALDTKIYTHPIAKPVLILDPYR